MVDYTAFATAFLEGSAKIINERKDKNEDYEDKQRELAEKNKGIITKRKQIVGQARTLAAQAKDLKASDEMISAAMQSGPTGLTNLVNQLSKGKAVAGDRWDEQAAANMVALPEGYTIPEGDLQSRIAQTYGLPEASVGSTEAPETSWWQRATGKGGQARVRSELDAEASFGGYSVMDINELAQMEAYNSLSSGTFVNYTVPKAFTPDMVNSEQSTINGLLKTTENNPDLIAANAELARLKSVKVDLSDPKVVADHEAAIDKQRAIVSNIQLGVLGPYLQQRQNVYPYGYLENMAPTVDPLLGAGGLANLLGQPVVDDSVTGPTDRVVGGVKAPNADTIVNAAAKGGGTVTPDRENNSLVVSLPKPIAALGNGSAFSLVTGPDGTITTVKGVDNEGKEFVIRDPKVVAQAVELIRGGLGVSADAVDAVDVTLPEDTMNNVLDPDRLDPRREGFVMPEAAAKGVTTALLAGQKTREALANVADVALPEGELTASYLNATDAMTSALNRGAANAADFIYGVMGGTEQTDVAEWLRADADRIDSKDDMTAERVSNKANQIAAAYVDGMNGLFGGLFSTETKAEATENVANVLSRGSDTPAAKALLETIQERVDYARNKRNEKPKPAVREAVANVPTEVAEAIEEAKKQGFIPATMGATELNTPAVRNANSKPKKKGKTTVEKAETPVAGIEAEAVLKKHGYAILKFLRAEGFTSEDTEEDIAQGVADWYANNSTDLSIKPGPVDKGPITYVLKQALDKE